MNNLRKIAAGSLAAVLAFSMAACGSSSEGPNPSPSVVEGATPGGSLRIGISFDQPGLGMKDGDKYTGFDVEVAPTRDTIYLTACPYASLVDEHPVICEIHARAVEQVLDGTGQDVRLKALDVFPRPGVCVARLNRTDVAPAWTVPGAAPEDGSSRTSRRTR